MTTRFDVLDMVVAVFAFVHAWITFKMYKIEMQMYFFSFIQNITIWLWNVWYGVMHISKNSLTLAMHMIKTYWNISLMHKTPQCIVVHFSFWKLLCIKISSTFFACVFKSYHTHRQPHLCFVHVSRSIKRQFFVFFSCSNHFHFKTSKLNWPIRFHTTYASIGQHFFVCLWHLICTRNMIVELWFARNWMQNYKM